MRAEEVIEQVLLNCKEDDVCIFTTGFTSRIAFSLRDRKANFYVLGSMGLVSSLGLGISLNTEKRVFVFDGDGSLLMNLGIMPVIAKCSPKNLFHCLLDNRSYSSTGNQPTVSAQMDWVGAARNAGYKGAFCISSSALKKSLKRYISLPGPVLLHFYTDPEPGEPAERVRISPEDMKKRLRVQLRKRRSQKRRLLKMARV